MRMTIIVFLFVGYFAFPFAVHACDWNMQDWHGDTPGREHGYEYYGCRSHGRKLQKNIQNMPGAELFESKGCTACHTIGEGGKTGPDLAGLLKRRDGKWVREFIQDPTSKIQTDEKAKSLREQYSSEMPQISLSPKELDQLIEFLKTATR